MWNPPVLHYERKVPEVHISSPEIQALSLCCSLPSLCVTLKYAAYHKHSWSPKLFSSYFFLFSYWNRFSLGLCWLSLAQTKAQSPSGRKFAREGLAGSKLLAICWTLLQSKREFIWEPDIVKSLGLGTVWHIAIGLLYLMQVTPVLAKGFVRGQRTSNIYLSFRVSNELVIL